MTNYELWEALADAKHQILCDVDPHPASDARWNALARRHFGVSLLTHKETAIRQLNDLAERLDGDGENVDVRAGVQALRFLVESGRSQGALWLIEQVASNVYEAAIRDPLPARAE